MLSLSSHLANVATNERPFTWSRGWFGMSFGMGACQGRDDLALSLAKPGLRIPREA
ncbi:hypothetical protein BRAO375_4920005 [Bradyrhizobium sp. ORS 375]|nr:hypothetical protein BRAO375_4920005 [Bradyrhizobium sp. ORS 375]